MIQLKNVTLRRSAKVLLDAASVTINPGEKVGLVGRNGAGKSTLFALFNGTLHEDGGDFSVPKQWRLAQVAQNMPETDESATDFVLGGDTKLGELRAALHAAEQAEDGMAMAHAHVDLADAGEHDAVPRAQSLILGLGFRTSELDQPVNSFSGGWRMRLQLARALMCPSDLLLLDEPTNHLDLDALVWLEAWLKRYSGTMIVISHDREFLDAVTDVTLHIEHAKLNRYGGNYSAFETLRSQQLELQQASFSKQQDKIAHLQKFIDRFKAKASKAKQAQSRVKALERMEKIAPVLADAEFIGGDHVLDVGGETLLVDCDRGTIHLARLADGELVELHGVAGDDRGAAERRECDVLRCGLARGNTDGGGLRRGTGVEDPHAHLAGRHAREAIASVGIGESLERGALNGDARALEVGAARGVEDAALD